MEIMRHVAKMANTDQRCVVAYMQIPNREDHALVIPVDGLHPRIEQAIMQVLKTSEGQQEETFANVLHRHRMPDTGDTILGALHRSGKLVPVPVTNILMLPQPNNPVRLSEILTKLGRMPDQLHESYSKNPMDFGRDKFNPHTSNHQATTNENNRNIARGLILEAEMLEAEANKKREAAYLQDPALRTQSDAPSLNTAAQLEIHDGDHYPQTPMQSFENRLAAIEEAVMKIVSFKAEEMEAEAVSTEETE